MTPTQFQTAGQLLWGPYYVTEMAKYLRVNRRTITRYDSEGHRIPASVQERLYQALLDRHARIGTVLNRTKLEGGK